MLETARLSKEWWGEAILTDCHVLNRVPMKNKKSNTIRGMGEEEANSFLFTHLGLLGQSQCANHQET
jgi:hypothetical protein